MTSEARVAASQAQTEQSANPPQQQSALKFLMKF